MKTSRHALVAILCALASMASAQTPHRQDTAALRQAAEQFLRVQTAGLPGKVDIAVGTVDARTNLTACGALEPFLPNGSRLWGKTTVGMRCREPAPWTIYISATVRVTGDYVAAAAPLVQGQMVGPNDIVKIKGDLTTLPNGIITDPSQAVGRTVTVSLPAGTPLRSDALRAQQAVLQGQSVRVVSAGPGFQVSTEGRALNNAAEGQVAQARTASGQVVSGVAKAGGVVEVTY
ncbi:MAG TPA: flagellar basal body P-ring formation chaperone FlgA [Noviherbaspirillum sp.]